VTGLSVGVEDDHENEPVVFVNFGGQLKEYHDGTWTLIGTGVTSFSASQVQGDAVYFSHGTDLWEYQGIRHGTAGTLTELASSRVTAFSAGDAGGGKAAVFVSFGGDLWDYTGAGDATHVRLASAGVTSFSASQSQADTVFVILAGQVKEHSGRNAATGWSLIL
jgi:hypothetical protein